MDQIQTIRIFIRVVELGSFSKAGEDMGIGQSSVTKRIAQLEERLGTRLLFRSTHGVTPTEVGERYYEKCKVIIRNVEEADSIADLMQSGVVGTLRVSCSVAFGRRVLLPLIIDFMRANPRLEIDLNFEDRRENLIARGIDVAVRLGPLADSTLGASYLGFTPWVAVAAPGYLARKGSLTTPAELAEHDALIYSTVQGDSRWHFHSADDEETVIPVKGPLRSNNLSALLAAATEGLGVAVLPAYVAQASIERGAVQVVLTDWRLPSQDIHAVYSSPRLVPIKARSLIKWLQGQFGEFWWTVRK